jgi:ATP-dependent Lon protease
MTGEISLKGKVMPIGGVRDKSLAAYRVGIKDIILCEENEKDLEEIPKEIKENIRFHIVKTFDEVLKVALVAKDYQDLLSGKSKPALVASEAKPKSRGRRKSVQIEATED